MRLPGSLTKLALTTHIILSVGWMGTVSVFIVLSIVAMTNSDEQVVRAVYIAMGETTWKVLVPISFGSLLSGVIQGSTTRWGLFRHYWVVFKLAINVFANAILLMYTNTLKELAHVAANSPSDIATLRTPTVLLHSSAALLLLVVATVLSVYKPKAMTPYGWRKQQEQLMS